MSLMASFGEGAPHGFTMTDTAMYNEAGEQRHWVATLEPLLTEQWHTDTFTPDVSARR